jgi:hypothetical protein
MINLLPPDIKDSYRYARRNINLRRWVISFVFAFIGLGLISTYGLVSLHQSETNYNNKITKIQDIFVKEKFTETESSIQDMSSSFKLVVQVLSKEVLFSSLLKQIAAIIPANANLTGLNINQTKGGLDISAITTDYNTAAQVQVNLSDTTNRIFSKADIVNTTCDSTASKITAYPCTVNIRALFATNNPFLLINSKQATP